MRSANLKKRVYTSILLLLLVFLIFISKSILIYSLIVLGILSLIEFNSLIKNIKLNNLYLFILNILFIIFIFIFTYLFLFFSNFLQLKIILFSLLLGSISSDIGGFIFGKIFKGPKLTKISPNKTISGAIGSIVFTTVVLSCIFIYFTSTLSIGIIITAIVTSVSCQIGDLSFSLLKRKAKVKDTGNFLPGHGGVLDRLDGIFLGIPMGFITLILFY